MPSCPDHHAFKQLSGLGQLRATAPAARKGECPFLAWLSHAARSLRLQLAQALGSRRFRYGAAPLDARSLNDSVSSRREVLDSGRNHLASVALSCLDRFGQAADVATTGLPKG